MCWGQKVEEDVSVTVFFVLAEDGIVPFFCVDVKRSCASLLRPTGISDQTALYRMTMVDQFVVPRCRAHCFRTFSSRDGLVGFSLSLNTHRNLTPELKQPLYSLTAQCLQKRDE